MTAIQTYLNGLKYAIGIPKLWIILYGFNLFFAFLIAWPLKSMMYRTTGRSLSLQNSLDAFDYPFISDMLNQHGHLFTTYLNQSMLVILIYLALSIFLSGGILETIIRQHGQFKRREFWAGTGDHFWRLLKTTLIFIFIHFFVLIIFAMIFARQGLDPLKITSDAALIKRLNVLVPLLLIIQFLIAMVHDFVKVALVMRREQSILRVFMAELKSIRSYFLKSTGIYLLGTLALLIVIYIQTKTRWLLPATDGTYILIGLLIAQLFILIRIGLKITLLSSIHLHKNTIIS